MATTVITDPTTKTVMIHPKLVGNQSPSVGIAIPNGSPTAVADTAIIAPARKQNIRALTTLKIDASLEPQIFLSCQYRVSFVFTATGAHKKAQLKTANTLPIINPQTKSTAATPCATNKGPITNSVPAVCSPAYIPTNPFQPLSLLLGTGSRSYSSVETSLLFSRCRKYWIIINYSLKILLQPINVF